MFTTVITTGSIIANRFRTSAAPLSAEIPQAVSRLNMDRRLDIKNLAVMEEE